MIGIQKGNGDLEPKIREISQYHEGHITIAAGMTTQGDGGICEATCVRWILLALYAANARSAIANSPARMVAGGVGMDAQRANGFVCSEVSQATGMSERA